MQLHLLGGLVFHGLYFMVPLLFDLYLNRNIGSDLLAVLLRRCSYIPT